MGTKKYNHTYALAFSVNTDRDAEAPVDPLEVIRSLQARIRDLTQAGEWDEALGAPFDTYENETETAHGANLETTK